MTANTDAEQSNFPGFRSKKMSFIFQIITNYAWVSSGRKFLRNEHTLPNKAVTYYYSITQLFVVYLPYMVDIREYSDLYFR